MASLEELRKERKEWRRKELNARRRYRSAVATGHKLADRNIPGHDKRRIRNLRTRLRAAEDWQRARIQRRQCDREIARAKNRPVVQVDQDGINFIILNEGLRTAPYNDSRGHATIGVGHLIHFGPVTEADKRRYSNFSLDDVMILLAADLDPREAVVATIMRGTRYWKDQRRFNALVSWTFNIGNDAAKNSTAARLIRLNKDPHEVAEAIMMWNKPPEIISRRKREADMFKEG